jgi:hypothetical protein
MSTSSRSFSSACASGDERRLGTNQLAQLIDNRREHLIRPGTTGDQRGHPPQRGLLADKLTQPCPARRITARPRVVDMIHVGSGVGSASNADGSPMLTGRLALDGEDHPRHAGSYLGMGASTSIWPSRTLVSNAVN